MKSVLVIILIRVIISFKETYKTHKESVRVCMCPFDNRLLGLVGKKKNMKDIQYHLPPDLSLKSDSLAFG